MVLLKVAIDGMQVDTTKWLICKLLEIQDDDIKIQFAMIITFIAWKLEITFNDSDRVYLRKLKVTYSLNVDALSKIKMIEKVQIGG